MPRKIQAALLVSVVALAGCTSTNTEWTRDATPRSEADQALAECQYQAEAATVTIGSSPVRRGESWGDAISDGVASGVVRGMDEAELVNSCMRAKGFSR